MTRQDALLKLRNALSISLSMVSVNPANLQHKQGMIRNELRRLSDFTAEPDAVFVEYVEDWIDQYIGGRL